MRDYKRVSDTMERIIYKYMKTERLSRDYGTGFPLTQAEIHTIQTIGDNQGINITNLAKEKSITKGGASQMVYRLMDKGLVQKTTSDHSDAEVSLQLTALGKNAYEGHKEYHKNESNGIFVMLKEMPEESYQQLVDALDAFEEFLSNRLQE